ncbi:hypothetical protein [Candidatus Contubernalis alkaliaceticus]|uniref:hypothetical protein n=1 Tax=Candidatus Contubernalis alkaliaceticus TaxID=338645 RepID=UPI001F4BE54F|nr:hypothetical protein [Candidatus Contubernalis alkalaceticus]UNC92060.1 hypothetical protein HUE98_08095 [Candidatus Contubernalis alkalaceticus]
MKVIKTKSTIKDIKVLDKSADVTHRMKNAFICTKEQAEQTQQANHDSYVEHAEDQAQEGAATLLHKVEHAAEYQGRKGIKKIKEHAIAQVRITIIQVLKMDIQGNKHHTLRLAIPGQITEL